MKYTGAQGSNPSARGCHKAGDLVLFDTGMYHAGCHAEDPSGLSTREGQRPPRGGGRRELRAFVILGAPRGLGAPHGLGVRECLPPPRGGG